MKNHLVSVIIPNYNHAPYLEQRIDSVLNQTFQDFELIILDDFSQDNSKGIIEKYRNHPKISHIVYNHTNSGSTFRQWEKGLELASGNWVWLAESDDWAEENFLEKLLDNSQECAVSLVYCDSYSADENGNVKGIINWAHAVQPKHWDKNYVNTGKEEIINYLFCRNTIPNASAVLVKKDVLENAVRSFPIKFKYAGDWYIWIKCLETGKIAFLKEPLNYFRQHKKSTRSNKSSKEERQRFDEYLYIINYLKVKYHLRLDPEKHYWIISEWVNKKFSDNTIINILFPPLPTKYYFLYYKMLFVGKLGSKLKKV